MTDKSGALVELSVDKLFNESARYIIPIYQRNYAWSNVEREQLLEDILDAEQEYFLGSLVVYERDDAVYEVIDGQQRLTTIFMLLAALKKNPPYKSLMFEARRKSNRTLEKISNGSTDYDEEFYTKELLGALNHFKKEVESDSEIIDKLQNTKLLRIIVPKDTDLNHYFEIMNTRGEQLEAHEIVKARLMSSIGGEKSQEKRSVFSKIWDACSHMEKYVQMAFSVEDRKKLFGSTHEKLNFSDFEDIFQNLFSATDGKEGKLSTTLSVIDAIEEYSKINNVNDNESGDEGNQRFESIITFPHFLLHVIKLYKNKQTDDDGALDDKKVLEIMNDEIDPEKFIVQLLKARYLFDKFIIKREYYGKHSEEGAWSLSKLKYYKTNNNNKVDYVHTFSNDSAGNDEDNRHKKIRMIQSALRITYTSPKTMHWITDSIAFLMENINKEDVSPNYLRLLENYAQRKVRESGYNRNDGFNIERVVFTYLDYLLWRDGYEDKIRPMEDYEFTFRNSIEHFYPQNPIGNEGYDKMDAADLNHFGNLCLITSSANSKFSNQSPIAKLTNKNTIKTSQKLKIMASIAKDKDWNEEVIKEHGAKMYEILEQELKKRSVLR
ncbi:DUF262 domain-containing protein [Gracilibacillus massiliensis]|uniref:DUF262 domain-containing protein n=1 Tax=Gracilibacillus massiliensis TaxID=1564956 RepID=UPI00071DCF75|nr:DUF262 domain-containing protein [Gracilibacillus massiliensis]